MNPKDLDRKIKAILVRHRGFYPVNGFTDTKNSRLVDDIKALLDDHVKAILPKKLPLQHHIQDYILNQYKGWNDAITTTLSNHESALGLNGGKRNE